MLRRQRNIRRLHCRRPRCGRRRRSPRGRLPPSGWCTAHGAKRGSGAGVARGRWEAACAPLADTSSELVAPGSIHPACHRRRDRVSCLHHRLLQSWHRCLMWHRDRTWPCRRDRAVRAHGPQNRPVAGWVRWRWNLRMAPTETIPWWFILLGVLLRRRRLYERRFFKTPLAVSGVTDTIRCRRCGRCRCCGRSAHRSGKASP
mmetsp:Transcript_137570/g.343293  ORF Transcript_137570/g.343293 Transcript_137570/m.343293 type:complete len:202 (-) Transcript_137570:469-1074(-)